MHQGDETQYISTMQAADALGVSISTVKRWVDDGILPAHRTAGGHRKLLRAEVLALARQGALPNRDLTGLSRRFAWGSSPWISRPSRRPCSLPCSMEMESRSSALIRRAYHSGAAIESLADQVIAPVMGRVGHDWETDRIEVWQEHRGTQLCAAALYDLKDELEGRAERSSSNRNRWGSRRRPLPAGDASSSVIALGRRLGTRQPRSQYTPRKSRQSDA